MHVPRKGHGLGMLISQVLRGLVRDHSLQEWHAHVVGNMRQERIKCLYSLSITMFYKDKFVLR